MRSSNGAALLVAFAVALAIDILSKLWVESHVELGTRTYLAGGVLQITHVRNPGSAFGMFVDVPQRWRTIGFAFVSVCAVAVIFSFFRRLAPGDRRNTAALGLILGGTIGNLVDRLWRQGEVIDFMHVRVWQGYPWPDFNFADVFIVVGVGALILDLLVSEADARAAAPTSGGVEPAPPTEKS